MKLKRTIALLLALLLCALPLVACNDPAPDEEVTVRLAGMTGPTSIGMVKLLKEDANGTSAVDYEFTLAQSGADIRAKLLQGEVDIAAIPANLAVNLYNNTEGKVTLLAVNTLGVVSILEKGNTVTGFADLAGKTVYAPSTAKGAIPELVFRYFLSVNGVNEADVDVQWIDATALAAKLKTEEGVLVLSPQPNATAILKNVEGAREALNLNDEWKKLNNGTEYITGVVVARTAFLEKHTDLVDAFLAEYEASIDYANQSVADTAALVSEFNILAVPVPVITEAIPACHIAFMDGEEMKAAVGAYVDLLFDLAPAAFGSAKPNDGFYYVAK